MKVPHWRITCFFIDHPARRQGTTEVALDAALRLSYATAEEERRRIPPRIRDR